MMELSRCINNDFKNMLMKRIHNREVISMFSFQSSKFSGKTKSHRNLNAHFQSFYEKNPTTEMTTILQIGKMVFVFHFLDFGTFY